MTPPDAERLFRVLAATWPPATTREQAGWTLREGAEGGKRVSAAVAGPGARAEDAPGLVQVRPWDAVLDGDLAARGSRGDGQIRLRRTLWIEPGSNLCNLPRSPLLAG